MVVVISTSEKKKSSDDDIAQLEIELQKARMIKAEHKAMAECRLAEEKAVGLGPIVLATLQGS